MSVCLIGLVFSYFSIILSYLDIKYREIPRSFSIFMLFCLFFTQISTSLYALIPAIAGALFAGIIFSFVYFATNKKMGIADIWYAIGAGFILGIKYFIVSVLFSCILAFFGIIASYFVQKKGKKEHSIPFIPFLSSGYFFSLFYYYLKNSI